MIIILDIDNSTYRIQGNMEDCDVKSTFAQIPLEKFQEELVPIL